MSAPPGFDPNVSMLKGAGDSAPPPVIAMRGGSLPNNYVEGGYKESLLPGGNGPIHAMRGGALTEETAKNGTKVAFKVAEVTKTGTIAGDDDEKNGTKVNFIAGEVTKTGTIVGDVDKTDAAAPKVSVKISDTETVVKLLSELSIDDSAEHVVVASGAAAGSAANSGSGSTGSTTVTGSTAATGSTADSAANSGSGSTGSTTATGSTADSAANSGTGSGATATAKTIDVDSTFGISLVEFMEAGGSDEQFIEFITEYPKCLTLGATGSESAICSKDGTDFMEILKKILINRLEAYSRECKFFHATEDTSVSTSKSATGTKPSGTKPSGTKTPDTKPSGTTTTSTTTSSGTPAGKPFTVENALKQQKQQKNVKAASKAVDKAIAAKKTAKALEEEALEKGKVIGMKPQPKKGGRTTSRKHLKRATTQTKRLLKRKSGTRRR
jgi:hypothetical protein